LRILHVASFSGNQGDIVNHRGFKLWFNRRITTDKEWNQLEIRDVYLGRKNFQEEVIDKANEYDLVVIGGGNYFETWPTSYWSGTSIDINLESFNDVRTPFFFNALGVDTGQGVSNNAMNNFSSLMDTILERENNLLTVRNDGSLLRLQNELNVNDNRIIQIPDAGFYQDLSETKENRSNTLVINVAGDMQQIRFKHKNGSSEDFVHLMSQFINRSQSLYNFDKIVFTLHVIGDLKIVNTIIDRLEENTRRHVLGLTSYGMHLNNTQEILEIYKSARLVIAQRFHANVLALAFRTPVIGITNYPQIKGLYDDLFCPEYSIRLESEKDLSNLEEITKFALAQPIEFMRRINHELDSMFSVAEKSHDNICNWIKRFA
jgi:polysaccharide pyruvyl transferase WcaK-like protein